MKNVSRKRDSMPGKMPAPEVMRRFIFFFSALLITAAMCHGCEKKAERGTYFRYAYQDEKYEIGGKYPVPDELSSRVNCYRFVVNDDGKVEKVEYLKRGQPGKDPYFGAAKVHVERRDDFRKIMYRDRRGRPSQNRKGVFALLLKLDENKNPVHVSNLDGEGNVMENASGVAHYALSLDEKGRKVKALFFDKNGNRITDRDGYYEVRYTYDDRGNIREMSNHGKDGSLLENRDGIAIIRQKFDEHKNIIEQKYLSAKGKLRENRDGFAIARMKYDKAGNRVEQSHFGANKKLTEVRDGIAVWQMEYDGRGELKKTVTLDGRGKITASGKN